MKGVVVIEALAQQALDHDGLDERIGEARVVIAQRGFDCGKYLRGARGGLDPFHLCIQHCCRYLDLVDPLQGGLFPQIDLHEISRAAAGSACSNGGF
ncbi:MAG TPA: hypothetical protein VGK48_22445 [Terriglobia bacterium]